MPRNAASWSLQLKMISMKERIKQLMESRGLSQKAFAQFTGISEGTLSGVLNDRTRPTLQIVEAIHTHFPNVSLEWLLYGLGNMENKKEGGEVAGKIAGGQASLKSEGSARQMSSTLFGTQGDAQVVTAGQTVGAAQKEIVKYIDKPVRKITEIRVFYDDQTWESFTPKH